MPAKVAFIFGSGDYKNGWQSLAGPPNDLQNLREKVKTLPEFTDDNVNCYSEVTHAALEQCRVDIPKLCKGATVVFLHWSGHAIGKALLVPVDDDGSCSLPVSLFDMLRMIAKHADEDARVVVTLDCCRTKRGGLDEPDPLKKLGSQMCHVFLLFACEPGCRAREDVCTQQGYLTKGMLQHFFKEGDLNSAYERIRESVQRDTNYLQKPWAVALGTRFAAPLSNPLLLTAKKLSNMKSFEFDSAPHASLLGTNTQPGSTAWGMSNGFRSYMSEQCSLREGLRIMSIQDSMETLSVEWRNLSDAKREQYHRQQAGSREHMLAKMLFTPPEDLEFATFTYEPFATKEPCFVKGIKSSWAEIKETFNLTPESEFQGPPLENADMFMNLGAGPNMFAVRSMDVFYHHYGEWKPFLSAKDLTRCPMAIAISSAL